MNPVAKYRSEIDGLRAVVVIPVLLFHAGILLYSLGFIGADIFFVISGYLITKIILSETQNNSFSILEFYNRRAKRILPVLLFVCLVLIPITFIVFTENDLYHHLLSLVSISTKEL